MLRGEARLVAEGSATVRDLDVQHAREERDPDVDPNSGAAGGAVLDTVADQFAEQQSRELQGLGIELRGEAFGKPLARRSRSLRSAVDSERQRITKRDGDADAWSVGVDKPAALRGWTSVA